MTAALSTIITGLVLAAVFVIMNGDDNAPIQVLPPSTTGESAIAGDSNGDSAGPTLEEDLRVYVSGAVRNPGVYRLESGQRLADAVYASGGAATDADLDAVNLAQRLQDGRQYHIPKAGESPPARAVVTDAATPAAVPECGGLVNLNAASESDLDTLPRIGPVRAGDIVAYRELNGPFTSVDEITEISGIGPATLEGIRPLVAVCG